MPTHANDDAPTALTTIADADELRRVEAWLMVELVEDDVDHAALAADLRLARAAIDLLEPTRARPALRVVAA